MVIMNSDETTTYTITHPLEKIADNSQITKSISTNAQGADTKTYRIKPANASPSIQPQSNKQVEYEHNEMGERT